MDEDKRLAQSLIDKLAILDNYLTTPRITFGKHRGKPYAEIVKSDRQYARWFVKNVKDKPISRSCMLSSLNC